MSRSTLIDVETADSLSATIARKVAVPQEMVLPFTDYTDILTELFSLTTTVENRVIAAGCVSPDVEIAADRAQSDIVLAQGPSPFSGDPDSAIAEVTTGREIIYVANPNRITGANLGLTDLELLARAIPEGTLIVDEQYFDFYGITALPLIEKLANVVAIRSLTTSFGISSDESGYVIASPTRIDTLREGFPWNRISSTLHKVLSTTLSNRDALAMRLKTFADEALRLAGALTKLGVQTRISATDFILIRVADPARVTNNLALAQIHTDNLSGVPELGNYIRYRLQSVNANTALLRAFERMPSEYYKTTGLDRRIVRLTRAKEDRPTTVTDRFNMTRDAGDRLAGDRK